MQNPRFQVIHLRDYQPPPYFIETVDLVFELLDGYTIVSNTMRCQRNKLQTVASELTLNGDGLELLKLLLNQQILNERQYSLNDGNLTLFDLPQQFVLTIVTKIFPERNSQLSGLYKSNSMYCTQNEAEGFRRITYFLDRPDVLSVYTTKIIASKNDYPVLLSNGNMTESGESDGGRHWVKWHDPYKKPCYLFALVAGKLICVTDHFMTRSHRRITLQIFVEPGNEDKCHHAMLSLKQAMKWDEESYGREYDLDIYMIVAVSHFNAGAMENKGLNIFNAQYVLAEPKMATDADYQHIQSVIAHEYFHNWTGNRVTCRDWFQLSLKEGLTVFRDQEFSRDLNSRDVMRILDVQNLRAMQFPEDAGPMAHPVRPESYLEINNFYTMTVYEKGAEVIRMLYTLLGKTTFFKGMDEYFRRFDGQAVTTEDFVLAHEIASGRDLTMFKRWYEQAGTPKVNIVTYYDADEKTYRIDLKQHTDPTPGQAVKEPVVIPLQCALFFPEAPRKMQSLPLIELLQAEMSLTIDNVSSKPILSVLRDFSAPVNVHYERDEAELQFLLAFDNNGFAKWEAGQQLLIQLLIPLIAPSSRTRALHISDAMLNAYKRIIEDNECDTLLKSKLFDMPSIQYLLDKVEIVDIDALHDALKSLKINIGRACFPLLKSQYEIFNDGKSYSNDHHSIARRAWKNTCLDYLMRSDPSDSVHLCLSQFNQADNMTDTIAALSSLLDQELPERKEALDKFYSTWCHEDLVVNKWLSIQARADSKTVLDTIEELLRHPAFDFKNPNKVRALIGAFAAGNHKHFHAQDGKGYDFLGEMILQLDKLNPQVTARLANAFTQWRKYDEPRQKLMIAQLERIQRHPNLSKNVYEVVSKTLQ